MSPDGRDLVKKLMHLNPLKRLGMGTMGNEMDYDAIKGHPNFEEIDFL